MVPSLLILNHRMAPSLIFNRYLVAGRILSSDGGMLFIYGPFTVDGQHTAPTNEAFDARLKAQNAEWGVRDTATLAAFATRHGLS